MTQTHVSAPPRRTERVLALLAACIGSLGLIKYLAIAIDMGVAKTPWGFLLIFVLPFAVGAALLRSGPRRSGAVVVGLFAAALAVVCCVIVAQGIQPEGADYLVLYGGGPLAVLAVILSVRVLLEREQGPQSR
jgi:peptidoglycan/LPS O-acetylase OafA/YrhL